MLRSNVFHQSSEARREALVTSGRMLWSIVNTSKGSVITRAQNLQGTRLSSTYGSSWGSSASSITEDLDEAINGNGSLTQEKSIVKSRHPLGERATSRRQSDEAPNDIRHNNSIYSVNLTDSFAWVNRVERWWFKLLDEKWRPMTPLERARRFPEAMMALAIRDTVQYQNIVDAKNTRRNAWTTNAPRNALWATSKPLHLISEQERAQVLSLLLAENREFHYGDDLSKDDKGQRIATRVPWRQQYQQRLPVEDLGRLGPLILLWIPPIVGFIPTILSIAAPQVFTRHFHNAYEIVKYSLIEEQQRRQEFPAVLQKGLSSASTQSLHRLQTFFSKIPLSNDDNQTNLSMTAFVQNPVGLYEALFGSSSVFQQRNSKALFSSLDDLPAPHIRHLALATGVYQSLRIPYLNQFMASMTPTALLRSQLRKILFTMVEEDAQLIVEGHERAQCTSLTDQEVLDACLMRNLPIVLDDEIERGPEVVQYHSMRLNLTDHLQCMASVYKHVLDTMRRQQGLAGELDQLEVHSLSESTKERLGMFAIHTAILRQEFHDRGNQALSGNTDAFARLQQ